MVHLPRPHHVDLGRRPDGNRIEIQVDSFATNRELFDWLTGGDSDTNPIGIEFDPAVLTPPRAGCRGCGSETRISTPGSAATTLGPAHPAMENPLTIVVAPRGSRPPIASKGHGARSITVTAHTYADLFDDELDDIAAAPDSLDDLQLAGRGSH